jgi:two-component system sensor histidine kinase ArlS
MSIKHKITLLTTLWLVGLLLVVNVTVYYTFLRINTDNEQDLLINRVNTLIQKAKPTDLIQGNAVELLQNYLPDQGMIRLLDSEGRILQTLQSDDTITQIHAEAIRTVEAELYHESIGTILMVRAPLLMGNEIIGTLEMAEKLDSLEENISLLISILLFSSLAAIGLSLIGGMYLSKWILSPISGMVRIMEEIERSLVFRKIPLRDNPKDELQAMAATFNRMMDRLEGNFIRQQQFISDASHELKTPLTIIEGYANMLRRWGLQNETNGREAVDSIYLEAVRMKQMTQQLLDLASTENKAEAAIEPIELVSLCEEAAQSMRNLHHRGIQVHSSDKEIRFQADPLKINQLLLILLDNAIKYSKRNVQMSLSVKANADNSHKAIELRVMDEGLGISKQEIPRVFERFYRVDPSRHRKTGGTGLGLSIARNIVYMHGGTIEIVSEEFVGTEIIVSFPTN